MIYIINLVVSFIEGIPESIIIIFARCGRLFSLPAGYRNDGMCWGIVCCHLDSPSPSSIVMTLYVTTSVIPSWWWWCPNALRVTNYNYKHPWEWLLSRIVPHPLYIHNYTNKHCIVICTIIIYKKKKILCDRIILVYCR